MVILSSIFKNTDRLLVLLQKYIGVIYGFLIVYILNIYEEYRFLALYLSLQTINEILAIIDSGNRALAIEKGFAAIYHIAMPIFFSLVFILGSIIIFLTTASIPTLWIIGLIISCFLYPLNIASQINLYDKKFKAYAIPILLSYCVNCLVFIVFLLKDLNLYIPVLSSVLLPQIIGGIYNIKNVKFSISLKLASIKHGMTASSLYGCSFFGISSIFIMYANEPGIIFVGITLKILTITNILAQNFNLFSSDYRSNNIQLNKEFFLAILIQSWISFLILYFAITIAFSNYLVDLNQKYIILCFIFVICFALCAAFGAELLAQGKILVYFWIELVAMILTMISRIFLMGKSSEEILASVVLFLFISCVLFTIRRKLWD